MRLPEDDEPLISVNLVPMIDVLFAVLAFLIVSMLFLNRSETLPVSLPPATTANTPEPLTLELTMTDRGDIYLGTNAVVLDVLAQEVKARLAPNQPAFITLRADERLSHGQVVKAMDQLRQVDGVQIGIATREP